MQTFNEQIRWLFILPLVIACISWTITHEEVFKEAREYCACKSKTCRNFIYRKFFYLFTCEYCFSHYVTLFILYISDYKLLYPDWKGYFIAGFALVWISNIYMSLQLLLRKFIAKEKAEIEQFEKN